MLREWLADADASLLRPDVVSLTLALAAGLVAFAVSGDLGASLAASIIMLVLVFPFAFVAREFLVLARRGLDEAGASRVSEWVRVVASRLNLGPVHVALTLADSRGLKVIGFGAGHARLGQKISSLIHKAAWHGGPVAEPLNGVVVLVIPGIVAERLSGKVVGNARGVKLVVDSRKVMIAAYKVVRALAYAATRSKLLAAYIASKTIVKLVMQGELVLALPWREVERIGRELPYEDPLTRFLVRRQLRNELAAVYA